jgi:hypothetical protein
MNTLPHIDRAILSASIFSLPLDVFSLSCEIYGTLRLRVSRDHAKKTITSRIRVHIYTAAG